MAMNLCSGLLGLLIGHRFKPMAISHEPTGGVFPTHKSIHVIVCERCGSQAKLEPADLAYRDEFNRIVNGPGGGE